MDLLEFLRRSLPALTSGANQPQTPPPPAPSINDAPVPHGNPFYPIMPDQPTPEQYAAQQAPLHAEGQSLFGHIMNALAPVPDATAGMLSPHDQRIAQLRSLGQLVAGAAGAYQRPGEQRNLATNIARGFDASQASMNDVLNASQAAANLQATNAKVADEQMKNAVTRQVMRQYPPAPGETQDQYIYRMSQMASMMAPTNPQGAAAIASVINSLQGGRQSASGQYAPPEWSSAYDKAHPEPKAGTRDHANWLADKGRAATDDQFGGTAMRYYQQSAQENRQGNFDKTSAQRDVSLGQGATRIVNAQEKGFYAMPDVKAIMTMVPVMQQMDQILAIADKGNEAAYKTTAMNFAQDVDQRAQLRAQILGEIQQFRPSLAGKFDIAWNKLASGTWDKTTLKDIREVTDAVKAGRRAQYTRAYEDFTKSDPASAQKVRAPERLFDFSTSATPVVVPPKPKLKLNPSATYTP